MVAGSLLGLDQTGVLEVSNGVGPIACVCVCVCVCVCGLCARARVLAPGGSSRSASPPRAWFDAGVVSTESTSLVLGYLAVQHRFQRALVGAGEAARSAVSTCMTRPNTGAGVRSCTQRKQTSCAPPLRLVEKVICWCCDFRKNCSRCWRWGAH